MFLRVKSLCSLMIRCEVMALLTNAPGTRMGACLNVPSPNETRGPGINTPRGGRDKGLSVNGKMRSSVNASGCRVLVPSDKKLVPNLSSRTSPVLAGLPTCCLHTISLSSARTHGNEKLNRDMSENLRDMRGDWKGILLFHCKPQLGTPMKQNLAALPRHLNSTVRKQKKELV